MKTSFYGTLLALAACVRPQTPPPAEPDAVRAADGPEITLEAQGLRLDFALRDIEERGEALFGRAELRIRDSEGRPATGLMPLGYLFAPNTEGDPSDHASCRRSLQSFARGLLSARPAADLGSYLVITMNDDNTVSALNPQRAFTRTKLEHQVALQGVPQAWALHPSGDFLFATLPDQDLVAVIDTRRFLVIGNIAVPPRPLALHVVDGAVWVTHEGGAVSVIDADTRSVVATHMLGPEAHLLTSTDGGTVWVAGAAELVLFDATSHTLRARQRAAGVRALAYSPSARAVYVAAASGLHAFDSESGEVRQHQPSALDIDELAFSPNGRWLFALRAARGDVQVYDASALLSEPRLLRAVEPRAPVFTRAFAYIQDAGSSDVQLVDLDSLEGGGELRTVRILVSQRRAGPFSDAVPTPDGASVIFARPEERTLYFYTEGMMAPIGSFRTYGKKPRRVLLLDRTLREREPGVYVTQAELGSDGDLVLGVRIGTLGLTACGAYPLGKRRSTKTQDELSVVIEDDEPLDPGETSTLRFTLVGAEKPHPPPRVVVFRLPGTWQDRPAVRASGPGQYELELLPPTAGRYMLYVSVPGAGEAAVPLAVGDAETRLSRARGRP